MFDSGQLFLDGVDKTTSISGPKGFSWGATRGARGDCTIPLQLMADDSYEPAVGHVIQIYDPPFGEPGAERVWIGTVEDFDIEFQDNDGLRVASIKGVTLHQMFDTQPCATAAFTDEPAESIFGYLFTHATFPVSVSLGTLDSGPNITRSYDPKTNIGSAYNQLATDSNGYWDIDPRPSVPTVNFVITTIPSAGFTLHDDNIVFGTNKYRQSRSDFRDKQIIQAPPGVSASLSESFDGDGSTVDFALSQLPTQIVSMFLSTSQQASVTGTFSGQPSDGDTITVAGVAYTFKNTLDNGIANQIKIGASFAATGSNATDAINAAAGGGGTAYSAPTSANGFVTAKWNGSAIMTLKAVAQGAAGNGILVSESAANFVWAAGTLSGGVTGQLQGLSFGSYAAGGFDVLWTPASPTVTAAIAPAVGTSLIVQYVSTMSAYPTVSNDTAAGLGIGSQYQIMTAQNASDYQSVVQQARAVLAGYSVIPGEYWFTSDDAGFFTGDGLDVALTKPSQLVALVNGQPWIIQDISAQWIEGMELVTVSGYGHFRVTVHCINTMAYTPYQQTLERLVSNPLDKLPSTSPVPTNGQNNDVVRIIYWDRLVLSDSTVANDVMPHVTVALPLISQSPLSYIVGKGLRCLAVLSHSISSTLTVRFNKQTNGSPVTTTSWTVTIPNGTPVDTVIETDISSIEFFEGDVISGDVTASDGSKATTKPWAIATFQIVWEA